MSLEQFTLALGIAAGGFQLIGYYVYLRVTKNANTGSWAIWTFGAILDVISYASITDDWVKNILPVVCALACIFTFCYLLKKGRFGWPDKVDWVFLTSDTAITIVWWQWATAVVANLLYQASTVLSYIPMIRGQLSGREPEKPFPWVLWTIAYALYTASVALRLDSWEELAYPGVHLLTSVVVLWIALAKRKPSQ